MHLNNDILGFVFRMVKNYVLSILCIETCILQTGDLAYPYVCMMW